MTLIATSFSLFEHNLHFSFTVRNAVNVLEFLGRNSEGYQQAKVSVEPDGMGNTMLREDLDQEALSINVSVRPFSINLIPAAKSCQ